MYDYILPVSDGPSLPGRWRRPRHWEKHVSTNLVSVLTRVAKYPVSFRLEWGHRFSAKMCQDLTQIIRSGTVCLIAPMEEVQSLQVKFQPATRATIVVGDS